MDATTRFDTQNVGALPVIANYMERLGLAEHVNDLVPWEGEVPLGTLVEVLVMNRLLHPRPCSEWICRRTPLPSPTTSAWKPDNSTTTAWAGRWSGWPSTQIESSPRWRSERSASPTWMSPRSITTSPASSCPVPTRSNCPKDSPHRPPCRPTAAPRVWSQERQAAPTGPQGHGRWRSAGGPQDTRR